MKSALLLLSAVSLAADEVSLTGKWNVHTSAAGNESDSTCTFTQKAAGLTGTCKGERGTVEIKRQGGRQERHVDVQG